MLTRVRFKLAILFVAAALVVLFGLARPAQAVGESIAITGYAIGGCPGPITIYVDYDMGTQATQLIGQVVEQSTFSSNSTILNPTGSGSLSLVVNAPANALPGLGINISAALRDAFTLPPLAFDSISTTCTPGACFGTGCAGGGGGSGGGKDKPEAPPFHYAVQPIGDPETEAMLLGTPNAGGMLPCGVFDPKGEGKTGWGYKVAYLPGWPDCLGYTPDLTILCYELISFWYVDENGEPQLFEGFRWRDASIEGLAVSDDGLEYQWYSKTDAYCGFFPQ